MSKRHHNKIAEEQQDTAQKKLVTLVKSLGWADSDEEIALYTKLMIRAVDKIKATQTQPVDKRGIDSGRRFLSWIVYFWEIANNNNISIHVPMLLTAYEIEAPKTVEEYEDVIKTYTQLISGTHLEILERNAVAWGYVYLIHAPVVNVHKIGYSQKPENRAKGLSQSLPTEMHSVVKHSILTDDMPRLEKWSHDTLSEYHHDKEWFKLNDIQIEEIESMEMLFFQLPRSQDHLSSREKTLKVARCHWLPEIKGKLKQKRLLD